MHKCRRRGLCCWADAARRATLLGVCACHGAVRCACHVDRGSISTCWCAENAWLAAITCHSIKRCANALAQQRRIGHGPAPRHPASAQSAATKLWVLRSRRRWPRPRGGACTVVAKGVCIPACMRCQTAKALGGQTASQPVAQPPCKHRGNWCQSGPWLRLTGVASSDTHGRLKSMPGLRALHGRESQASRSDQGATKRSFACATGTAWQARRWYPELADSRLLVCFDH